MPRPPGWDALRRLLESDRGFYTAVGLATVSIFGVALAGLAVVTPGGVGTVELLGFIGGFLVFVLVYLLAMTVTRIEAYEDV